MLTTSASTIISRRTRHLFRQFSNANGNDAVKGSGLRRIRGNNTSLSSQKSSATHHQQPPPPPSTPTTVDPHAIANEMVFSTAMTEGRTSGTEAIASMTREQKLSNYAMASGLLASVAYIFYYSLSSVGGVENTKQIFLGDGGGGSTGNPGFEEFLKDANEGRSQEERKLEEERVAKGHARELAELEHTTAARLKAEGVEDEIVASANEEEEKEMTRVAGFEEGSGGEVVMRKPFWEKIVFFWRRD